MDDHDELCFLLFRAIPFHLAATMHATARLLRLTGRRLTWLLFLLALLLVRL